MSGDVSGTQLEGGGGDLHPFLKIEKIDYQKTLQYEFNLFH